MYETYIQIVPLVPQGTNSTMFTACCHVAICDRETKCPRCRKKVIGADCVSDFARRELRWKNATRYWKR